MRDGVNDSTVIPLISTPSHGNGMISTNPTRRQFLKQTGFAATTAFAATTGIANHAAEDAPRAELYLSTNAYSWNVFYQREGKNFGALLSEGLAEVKAAGLNGFEPSAGSVEDVENLAPVLSQKGLEMRSLYVNSTLHTPAEAEKSLMHIMAIARAAKAVGTRIIVTNPNPIQWGGTEAKDDLQLRVQAGALERLGRALQGLGLTLAYHNHDMELRQAAREFHHMMVGTDPRLVHLCLDAHWIYRGSGDSQVALMDVVKLYGGRVAEVHLRQSEKGIWSETLGPGDIDYPALAAALQEAGAHPHLVLEIAVEKGTPKTLSPLEAHRRSAEYARTVLAKLS